MKAACYAALVFEIMAFQLHDQRAATTFGQERPVFRASTTAVSVHVAVRAGNLPVGGLSATDFSLTDQGVPQDVALVEVAAVPLDVTAVVDVGARAADRFERLQDDVGAIAGLLRPDDRLRLIGYGYDVVETLPLQAAAKTPRLERMVTLGGTSLHDAVAAALVQRPDPNRRRLIVVLADRTDTLSVLDAGRVLAIARRADAVLHVIGLESGCVPSTTSWRRGEPRPPEFRPPERPIVRYPAAVPCDPAAVETLTEAAHATGGALHRLSWISASAVHGFKKAFEDFGSSYVLRYTPLGVAPEGWHQVDVKVLRPGRFAVRARKGYFGGRP